ncbi:MAG: RHS repeat-associated core domain-containing protein, partial [Nitrososphaerales archaeon]
STTALTDGAGATVESYSYSPYGAVTSTGSVANPLTYTGQQFDSSDGLYYMNARDYDPATQRFLSRDPVESSNPYSYAGDDPVNFEDPTGADAIETGILFQWVQDNDAYLTSLVSGITNYLDVCATAELSPGADSNLACSEGFFAASVLDSVLQTENDIAIGFVFSSPLASIAAHAGFDAAGAGALEALDESVGYPTRAVNGGQVGSQAQGGAVNSVESNLPGVGASDPFGEDYEGPGLGDVFALVGGAFVGSWQEANQAQSGYQGAQGG